MEHRCSRGIVWVKQDDNDIPEPHLVLDDDAQTSGKAADAVAVGNYLYGPLPHSTL